MIPLQDNPESKDLYRQYRSVSKSMCVGGANVQQCVNCVIVVRKLTCLHDFTDSVSFDLQVAEQIVRAKKEYEALLEERWVGTCAHFYHQLVNHRSHTKG